MPYTHLGFFSHLLPQNASGHTLAIPMPGHPIPPASIDQAKADVAKLELLFDDHDAIFLLMDSRESRWLPTLLGAAKNKVHQLMINTSSSQPLFFL